MGRPGPRSPYRISSRADPDNKPSDRARTETSARGLARPDIDKYSDQSDRAGPGGPIVHL